MVDRLKLKIRVEQGDYLSRNRMLIVPVQHIKPSFAFGSKLHKRIISQLFCLLDRTLFSSGLARCYPDFNDHLCQSYGKHSIPESKDEQLAPFIVPT